MLLNTILPKAVLPFPRKERALQLEHNVPILSITLFDVITSPPLPVVVQLSQTALNVASRNGQLEVVQALVAAGAFLNIKDNVGARMGKGLGLMKQLGEWGAGTIK